MDSSSDEDQPGSLGEEKSGSVVDVEDLGDIMSSVRKAKVSLLMFLAGSCGSMVSESEV